MHLFKLDHSRYGAHLILGFRISNRTFVRYNFERNPSGKGWCLNVYFGPGAGYRWVDLPGYSMNIHDPWYRHLSITGRTLTIGTHMKAHHPSRKLRFVVSLRKCGNSTVFPGWW